MAIYDQFDRGFDTEDELLLKNLTARTRVYVLPDSAPAPLGWGEMFGRTLDAEEADGALTRITAEVNRNIAEHRDASYIAPEQKRLLESIGGPLLAEALRQV